MPRRTNKPRGRSARQRRRRGAVRPDRPGKQPAPTAEQAKEYILEAADRSELPMQWPLRDQIVHVLRRAKFEGVWVREIEPRVCYRFSVRQPEKARLSETAARTRLQGLLARLDRTVERYGLDVFSAKYRLHAIIRLSKP